MTDLIGIYRIECDFDEMHLFQFFTAPSVKMESHKFNYQSSDYELNDVNVR